MADPESPLAEDSFFQLLISQGVEVVHKIISWTHESPDIILEVSNQTGDYFVYSSTR